jgi:two-component system, OmpR family, response regulator
MITRAFQSVLFVDDDPDICSVVQATLGLVSGLNVQTADSGERAIDLAYEGRPELVLMDVMMPGLDGPSTFKRMRESALLTDIPVIFMTAKVLPVEVSQFLQLGAIGVIVKPFDPLKLYDDMLGLWSNRGSATPNSPVCGGQTSSSAQMNSLTVNFLRRASADVISLSKMIGFAERGDRSVFKAIEHVSHSIHGTGAMFGFPKISEVGGTMARMAELLGAADLPPDAVSDPDVLEKLSEAGKQLAREVAAAWETAPEGAAMFQGPFAAK